MKNQLLFPVGLLCFTIGVLVMVMVTRFNAESYDLASNINSGDDVHVDMMIGSGSHHVDNQSYDHAMVEHVQLPVPSISISVTPDLKSGYNLNINTSNFAFSPQAVGGTDVFNQGHAHVYVNDIKVGRAYGPWFHIDDSWFRTGENTVVVILNSDSHNEWLVNDEHIMAKEIVVNNSLQQ